MCLTGISELKDVRSFDDLIKFFRNPCGDYNDYTGDIRTRAAQMTRKEYNNLRGGVIVATEVGAVPENENPEDIGYVIALGDGSNLHITWLPIDVFEKTYKKCETFKDRLKIEIQELKERIQKAEAFYNRSYLIDTTDCEDRMYLAMQLSHMHAYLSTLKLRMKKIEIGW